MPAYPLMSIAKSTGSESECGLGLGIFRTHVLTVRSNSKYPGSTAWYYSRTSR